MTLEVITGPMFSGKTSELIRVVERDVIAKRKGAIFKIAFDRRFSEHQVVTHNGLRYGAYSVSDSPDGLKSVEDASVSQALDVVGVDEVNFFPRGIVELLGLLSENRRVVASGLNLDFRAEPFESTKELLVRADKITYLSAVCAVCGRDATRSQRLVEGKPAPRDSPLVLVGGKELYEPRCRTCYQPAV